MKIFVVTNPELGWDCVVRVIQAVSLKQAQLYFRKEWNLPEDYDLDDGEYVFHEQKLHIAGG